jgi:succinate-semialdehyde dehydrogenase/glutarate-semialdehyde dehydrogenase
MNFPEPRLYIAGCWLADAGGGTRALIDPATEQALAQLPLANAATIDAAADSAARGFAEWRRRLPIERCAVLQRAAALMRERADHMAAVLTAEQGKPLAEALREVRLSADIVDFQAEEAKRLYGRTVPPRVAGILSHTVLHQPVGVVAAFTAWNFPVNLPARCCSCNACSMPACPPRWCSWCAASRPRCRRA